MDILLHPIKISNVEKKSIINETYYKIDKNLKPLLDRILPILDDYLNVDITKEFNSDALISLVKEVEENLKTKDFQERDLAAVTVGRMNLRGWIQEPDNYTPVYPYRGMFYLNPYIGCNYGCIYCYRNDSNGKSKDWYLKGKPVRIMSSKEAVDRMVQHPWFIPNVTQIGLHSSTTDPFLPTVKESTFEMIEEISSRGLKNDIIIISKFYLTKADVKRLDSFKDNKIILFLTYTANPKEVEPLGNIPKIKEARWKTREFLQEAEHVKWGHYYRPIVEGWNDSEERIKEALEFGEPSGLSVLGGLKMIGNMEELSRQAGVPIPKGEFSGRNYKYLNPTILDKILNIHKKYNFTSVLVGDQSCGITVLKGKYGDKIPNVEGLRMYDDYLFKQQQSSRPDNNLAKGCFELCGKEQLEKCMRINEPMPTKDEILKILDRFGIPNAKFELKKEGIFIEEIGKEIPLHMRMGISSTLKYAVFFKDKVKVP